MLRSHSEEIQCWKCTSTVPLCNACFVVVVLCVVLCLECCIKRDKLQGRLFPPSSGLWLLPLQRLPLQIPGNVCGTCFILTLLRLFGCQSRVRKARKLLPTTPHCRNSLSLPYINIHSCLFEQCTIQRIRKCEVSSLSGCDGMSSCSQREMYAGRGCSSHQLWTGWTGVSVSEHLVAVSRWDLMTEMIWITEYYSMEPLTLILVSQQQIRQDGTLVQTTHHWPLTPPAGDPEWAEGCRWRYQLKTCIIHVCCCWFKGCSLSLESFPIRLTRCDGPPLHFKLRSRKNKHI